VDLVIRALARADRATRLVVVGEGPLRASLEATAAAEGVADRVTFAGGGDQPQLVGFYAGAVAVRFPPLDEDYGYLTREAFLARRPVITTTDAGGPLEFVEDGATGLVADPTPDAIGGAIAALAAHRSRAQALGEAGYDRASRITWDGVVDRLMAARG